MAYALPIPTDLGFWSLVFWVVLVACTGSAGAGVIDASWS